MNSVGENSPELELEALKTLHDGHLRNLHALSEQPFRTVLQTVTLNVAVVAGLVAGKVMLSDVGKELGSILLAVFNVVVIAYLTRQASIHDKEKQQYQKIKNALLRKCPSLTTKDANEQHWCCCCPLLTGTRLFCVTVVIAACFSIAALWFPFITPCENPQSALKKHLSTG